MRAYWVAEEMENAQVIRFNDPLPDADVYIWQKAADMEMIKARPNAQHYWDVCDPSWWWQPGECWQIANLVDGVIASNAGLALDFNEWIDDELAIVIPDRLKLSHFHSQRQHREVDPVRFIWFGIAVNRIALFGVIAYLERLTVNGYNVELTLMDERPGTPFNVTNHFPIYHKEWKLGNEVETLAAHDIALLPTYPGPWGQVKSNNKRLTAKACGLPVLGDDPYRRFEEYSGSAYKRRTISQNNYEHVCREWDVKQSAADWLRILQPSETSPTWGVLCT